LNTAGNFYSGAYGLQVYELNTATLPGNINSFDGVNSTTAYQNMLADGYTLQGSFTGKTITAANAGVFSLGSLNMAGVSPAGGTVSIALVAWTGAGTSFPSSGNAGVITFVNPTSDYTATPTPTPKNLTGWGSLGKDLIMTPVPEPATFALAGLGAAALMIFRRRK
jgi:hypothetical protein